MKTAVVLSILLLVLLGGNLPTAFAAEPTIQDKWEFNAEVYLWGARVGGESVSGSDVQISFGDLLDNLKMGFMASVGARKDRWSFVADVIYVDVKEEGKIDDLDASVALRSWVITPDAGYTVWRGYVGYLDFHIGLRYLYMKPELKLGPNEVAESDNIWDGVFGFRGRVDLTDGFYLPFYVDLGSGGSEVSYQAMGALSYQYKHLEVLAGFRYLRVKFDDNPALDHVVLSGPYGGVRFTF